eukprot:651471-Hanusia_phi.AAC.3
MALEVVTLLPFGSRKRLTLRSRIANRLFWRAWKGDALRPDPGHLLPHGFQPLQGLGRHAALQGVVDGAGDLEQVRWVYISKELLLRFALQPVGPRHRSALALCPLLLRVGVGGNIAGDPAREGLVLQGDLFHHALQLGHHVVHPKGLQHGARLQRPLRQEAVQILLRERLRLGGQPPHGVVLELPGDGEQEGEVCDDVPLPVLGGLPLRQAPLELPPASPGIEQHGVGAQDLDAGADAQRCDSSRLGSWSVPSASCTCGAARCPAGERSRGAGRSRSTSSGSWCGTPLAAVPRCRGPSAERWP